MKDSPSRGKMLHNMLRESLCALQRGFAVTDRERPVIWGVSANGTLVNGMTLAAFLARGTEELLDSGKVYRYGDTLVYEFRDPSNQRLLLLSSPGEPAPHAATILSNLLAVGVQSEESASQSLVPARLVRALLANEELWQRLPAIRTYAQRAVFDEDYNLRGPGWHPEQGILVHGPDIIPAVLPPVAPSEVSSIDRFPPNLKRLLQDFCVASEADRENILALLLTGLLCNHFVTNPKPMGLIDGNQQGIGKTLLCQVIGQVLDGREPERIPFVRDEELEKKVGAKLRESQSSVFFFDNVKAKLESPFVEANALSPHLSVRMLGHSRNINRPNTYLWLASSNLTSGSSDIVTRGLPIRLSYEGDPVARIFSENLLEFAAEHRLEILGELAAMVLRWRQAGKPSARDIWPAGRPAPRHRCETWAQVIGGILGCSGFYNFLSNIEEARAAMDEGLQALATLAEHVALKNTGFSNPLSTDPERGKLPRDWTALFTAAGVFQDKLADKTARGRDTWVGTFLSGKTDRVVSITIGTGSGTAVLRRNPVRNDQKRYYFEITPAVPTAPLPSHPDSPSASDTERGGNSPGATTVPTTTLAPVEADEQDAGAGETGLQWL